MSLNHIVWLLLVNGVIGVALLFLERQTRRPGRHYGCFAPTVIGLLIWIFAYAAELAARESEWMLPLANIQFIGIGAVPYLLYSTVRQFLGREPVRKWITVLAAVVPLVTVVLAFTDARFGLLRLDSVVVEEYGIVQLDVRYGLWHNAGFVTYQYGFYIATLIHLLRTALRSPAIFKGRIYAFAVGMVIPMAGGALYVLNLPPFTIFNPVSVLLMTTFGIFGISMFRHHIRDVVPVAVDQVLDTLDEAIIVLDENENIVEYNTAAASLFAELSPLALGRNLIDSFGRESGILTLVRDRTGSDSDFSLTSPMGRIKCRGRSKSVIGVDGSRIGRLLTIFETELFHVDEAEAETTDDMARLLIGREFFDKAGKALADSREKGQEFFLAAVIIRNAETVESFRVALNHIVELVTPPESVCFNGDGRFFLSLPGRQKDEVLLRARTLFRDLESRGLISRFGVAGSTGDTEITAEELASRALRTVLNSRQSVSYGAA